MKPIFKNRPFLSQYILTSMVLFVLYMIFAMLDSDWGLDGLIGLIIFQPILAIIFTILTIVICYVLGLPIRLISKLNQWWKKNYLISIIGIVTGLTLIIVSNMDYFSSIIEVEIEGFLRKKQEPNLYLLTTGWFLTAFMTLHLYIFENKPENKNAV